MNGGLERSPVRVGVGVMSKQEIDKKRNWKGRKNQMLYGHEEVWILF